MSHHPEDDPQEPHRLGDLFGIANREYPDDDRLTASVDEWPHGAPNGSQPDDTFEAADYEPTFEKAPWQAYHTLALVLIRVLGCLVLIVPIGLGILLARGHITSNVAVAGTVLIETPALALLGVVVNFYFKHK